MHVKDIISSPITATKAYTRVPDTALIATTLGDGDDGDAAVSIGSDKTEHIIPQINGSRWNDECWFNLNHKDTEIKASTTSGFDNGVVWHQTDDIRHESWLLNDAVQEYCIVFAGKPNKNYIQLAAINSQGLEWCYQPPLTKDELALGMERAERAQGSYALYHSKMNNQYKVGKMAHLYRWEVIDAHGNREWCDPLVLDDIGGTRHLVIGLPVGFMARASYPVIAMGAGDTIGYETIGASTAALSYLALSNVPGENGTLNGINVACYRATGSGNSVDCAVYDHSDRSLITSTGKVNDTGWSTTASWAASIFTLSGTLSVNEEYDIGVAMGDTNNWPRIRYDTGQAATFYFYGDAGLFIENLPDPYTRDASFINYRASAYLDYNPFPVLTSATPSGTLDTTTTATLGATTDTTSGTFYGVVDTAANITGITAAQIKLGNNNSDVAAVGSDFNTVTDTSPTADITGLTANTLYSYAVVHNVTGGDSNVLTGTFTTAASTFTADQGTYTLTGQDVGLTWHRLLTADQGTYTMTGQDAGLNTGNVLTAELGNYTLTGQAAGLTWHRLLTADQGAYTLTGQDAGLTYVSTGSILAEQGTYTLTGQDAGLTWQRLLTADQGAYTLTGQDATLNYGIGITAEQGAYALTGQDTGLIWHQLLTAEQGAYSLTGQDASLLYSGIADLIADSRTINVLAEDRSISILAEDRTINI